MANGKLPSSLGLAFHGRRAENHERLGFIVIRRYQQRHAGSAKLYGDALTAEAKLADNSSVGHRYNAAAPIKGYISARKSSLFVQFVPPSSV